MRINTEHCIRTIKVIDLVLWWYVCVLIHIRYGYINEKSIDFYVEAMYAQKNINVIVDEIDAT